MTPTLLAQIWFGIICLEAALYVILDGGNLGIGMLSLLPQVKDSRETILRAFGPMWDANETWLLIAAATTYGAFPAVYSIALNALYIPAMIFGVGLVVRVVSYEFYHTGGHALWRVLFGIGSLLAVIGQGCLIGGLLSGITIVDGHFGGGAFDWATPLTALFAIGIFFAYLILGYTYIMRYRGEEDVPDIFANISIASLVTFISLLAATYFLPKGNYTFFMRWSEPPASYILATIAVCIGLVGAAFVYDVCTRRRAQDLYGLAVLIFVLGYVGMIVGVYPYILPPSVSIFEAASSPNTQMFMLWGIGPILPIVLAYNYFIHRLFQSDV